VTRLPTLLSLTLALAACPPEDAGDTTDGATTTAGTDTSEVPTTGEPATGDEQALLCQQACAHLEACGGDSIYFAQFGLSGCVSLCERAALLDTEFCRSSVVDLYTCLRDGSCEDVAGVPSGACGVANADYAISCAGCPAFIVGSASEACGAGVDCVHAWTVEFACAGDTCRCIYDDDGDDPEVEFAACPAAAVCAADDATIYAAAEACCDMPFTPYDFGP
jgi:hypothetical protein